MDYKWNNSTPQSIFRKKSSPRIISVALSKEEHAQQPRAPHSHVDRLELLLIRHGTGFHTIDGNRYMGCRGDIIIHNKGSVHDKYTNLESGKSFFFCALRDVHMAGAGKNQLIKENCLPVIKSGKYFEEVESLFSILFNQVKEGRADMAEYDDHILKALLIRVHSLVQEQSIQIIDEEKQLGNRIKEYLDSLFAEELNLQTIASDMGISAFHLSHVFKKATGYSPIQYQNRRKIGEAQSDLLYTSRSITEIAHNVGFNNTNHFNNTFCKIIGMTPGRYRKYWTDQ